MMNLTGKSFLKLLDLSPDEIAVAVHREGVAGLCRDLRAVFGPFHEGVSRSWCSLDGTRLALVEGAASCGRSAISWIGRSGDFRAAEEAFSSLSADVG